MRLALALLLFLPACFADAPPVDDEDDGIAAEDDEAPDDDGSSDDGEDSSSSGGEPADPLDAYGPCEVDSDCELVPGDKGEIGESPRCVERTCTIRCAQAAHSNDVCPGYFDLNTAGDYPIGCNDDGYCTVRKDPFGGPGCPDGMMFSQVETVPELTCVWEP